MKTLIVEEVLSYPLTEVWEVFSDVTRCDWVPAVESISEQGGVRSFTMEGIGEVQEKILTLDHKNYCLQYSVIKTPTPLEHHLATIQFTSVLSAAGESCGFTWTTEIAPDQFAEAIDHGMAVSFAGLKSVLAGDR